MSDEYNKKAEKAYKAIEALFTPDSLRKKEPTDEDIQGCVRAECETDRIWARVLRRMADLLEDRPSPFRRLVVYALTLRHAVVIQSSDELVLELARTVNRDGDDDGLCVEGRKKEVVQIAYKRGKVYIPRGPGTSWEWDPLELEDFLTRAPALLGKIRVRSW